MPSIFIFGDQAKKYPTRIRSVERRLLIIEAVLVFPLIFLLFERVYNRFIKRRVRKWVGHIPGERIFVDWKPIFERAAWTAAFNAAVLLTADGVDLYNVSTWKKAASVAFVTGLSVLKNYVAQWRHLPKEPTDASPVIGDNRANES